MKKIIVFVMLIMCVASVSAQWSVTPEAGMNVTKYKGSVPKIGYKAGAAVEYAFGEGAFSLQSGLYYVRRGTGMNTSYEMFGKIPGEEPRDGSIWLTPGYEDSYYSNSYGYEGGYGYGDGYGGGYGYTGGIYGLGGFKMDVEGLNIYRRKEWKESLQLPILARFNWKVGKDVKIHLAAGPYFAIGIKGESLYKNATWHNDGRLIERSETTNPYTGYGTWSGESRFDWGLSLNTGIEVKQVTFDISYDAGFGEDYSGAATLAPKYHTTSFTMGYKF